MPENTSVAVAVDRVIETTRRLIEKHAPDDQKRSQSERLRAALHEPDDEVGREVRRRLEGSDG